MSSSISLTFAQPIARDNWLAFCKRYRVEYSPQTVGGNTFYVNGHGGVEIWFGETSKVMPPEPPQPPAMATEVRVGSFFGRNLNLIATTAVLILDIFTASDGRWHADPELKAAMLESLPDKEQPER